MSRLIQVYRLVLAPFVGGACRYYPSCSEYAEVVIERDGIWRGGARAVGRFLRCLPGARGGLDLP